MALDKTMLSMESLPEWQELSPETRTKIRELYFDEVVTPKLGNDAYVIAKAKESFLKEHSFQSADPDVVRLYRSDKFQALPADEKQAQIDKVFDQKNKSSSTHMTPEDIEYKRDMYRAQNTLMSEDKPGWGSALVDMAKNVPRATFTGIGQGLRQSAYGGTAVPSDDEVDLEALSTSEGAEDFIQQRNDEQRERLGNVDYLTRDGFQGWVNESSAAKSKNDALYEAKYGHLKSDYLDPSGVNASLGSTVGGAVVGGTMLLASRGAAAGTMLATNSILGASSKDEFIRQAVIKANEESRMKNRRSLTRDEQTAIIERLNSAGNEYGLWEAATEIFGDATAGSIMRAVPGGKTFLQKLGRAAFGLGVDLAAEHAGETVAGHEQNRIEAENGMAEPYAHGAEGWGQAFKDQAGTTNLMFGLGKAPTITASAYRAAAGKPVFEEDRFKADTSPVTQEKAVTAPNAPEAGEQVSDAAENPYKHRDLIKSDETETEGTTDNPFGDDNVNPNSPFKSTAVDTGRKDEFDLLKSAASEHLGLIGGSKNVAINGAKYKFDPQTVVDQSIVEPQVIDAPNQNGVIPQSWSGNEQAASDLLDMSGSESGITQIMNDMTALSEAFAQTGDDEYGDVVRNSIELFRANGINDVADDIERVFNEQIAAKADQGMDQPVQEEPDKLPEDGMPSVLQKEEILPEQGMNEDIKQVENVTDVNEAPIEEPDKLPEGGMESSAAQESVQQPEQNNDQTDDIVIPDFLRNEAKLAEEIVLFCRDPKNKQTILDRIDQEDQLDNQTMSAMVELLRKNGFDEFADRIEEKRATNDDKTSAEQKTEEKTFGLTPRYKDHLNEFDALEQNAKQKIANAKTQDEIDHAVDDFKNEAEQYRQWIDYSDQLLDDAVSKRRQELNNEAYAKLRNDEEEEKFNRGEWADATGWGKGFVEKKDADKELNRLKSENPDVDYRLTDESVQTPFGYVDGWRIIRRKKGVSEDPEPVTDIKKEYVQPGINNKGFVEFKNRNFKFPGDRGSWVKKGDHGQFTVNIAPGISDDYKSEIEEFVTDITGDAERFEKAINNGEKRFVITQKEEEKHDEEVENTSNNSNSAQNASAQIPERTEKPKLATQEKIEAAEQRAVTDADKEFWMMLYHRIDPKSMKADWEETYTDLYKNRGKVLFSRGDEQGLSVDELADELERRGYIEHDGGSDALVERLKNSEIPDFKTWQRWKREDNGRPVTVDKRPDFGTAKKPNTVTLGQYFADQFRDGRAYKNIGEARQEAAELIGVKVKDIVRVLKDIDESIELGVVIAARDIVNNGDDELITFRHLVDLYNRQPNLGTRTSTSMRDQAYSTPIPLGYLVDKLAGITNRTDGVLEPSAGNGALLIAAGKKNVVANEINPDRNERLRSQGFGIVTSFDATEMWSKHKWGAIVGNPPFGTLKEGGENKIFDVYGFKTKEIDQAIMLQALHDLKEDGRAVFIIGGKMGGDESRSKSYNSASQRAFWNELFNNYNVVDHFTVSGDLYSRQGAGFPIDFIVIDGHTPTKDPIFPAANLPRVFTSFEELEEKLNEGIQNNRRRNNAVVSERGSSGTKEQERPDERDSGMGSGVSSGELSGRETGNTADVAGGDSVLQRDNSGNARSEKRETGESGTGRSDGSAADNTGSTRRTDMETGRSIDTGELSGLSDQETGDGSGTGTGYRNTNEQPNTKVESKEQSVPKTDKAKKAQSKPKETETQSAYTPSSSAFSLGTLVPKNMATPVQNALKTVAENTNGSLDEYVTKELGYDSVEDMHNAFAAEQVDALSLAIDNISKGKGFILGDQTGIGKGRVCAGIIRWAKRHGKIPVFVTMLPDLYADMMRDLNDIGVNDFKPFITNTSITGEKSLVAPDGSQLSSPKKKEYESIQDYILGNKKLPDGYDGIFTSYSQLQEIKKKPSARQLMMNALKKNCVLILDEAHNAGGSSSSIGTYIRNFTFDMPNGVLYSSATYAKRPDVMSLYNKTDLTMLGSQDDLEGITQRGGLAMQQVLSAMLSESAQYIRREKSYEGAEMTTSVTKIDKKVADGMARSLEAIMAFSTYKDEIVSAINQKIKKNGKTAEGRKSTGKEGASSISFGSVMHNLISQATLAIKSDAVIESAKRAVDNGEKPIITLSNTMGSFIEDYAQNNKLKQGDEINLDFSALFEHYLEETRHYTIKLADGKTDIKMRLEDEDLGSAGVMLYDNAMMAIRSSGVKNLPLSPIDYVLNGLEKAGIKASEITGRTVRVDYSDGTPRFRTRVADVAAKQKASMGFNSGDINCLIINRSGSTGISLHASEKFADQKRRAMLILQPDLNIDVFMQTLGRVFRTGQVVPPRYEFILSDMPSEMRPAAVLGKKMASLNANTTASSKGTQSFDNIPDFLNEYGDKAAFELLTEDSELNSRLGGIISDSSSEDGVVAKLTGRIPLLTMDEQADVYDRLQRGYQSMIDIADATGTNVLDTKSKPLDANIIKSQVFTTGNESNSPFAESSTMHIMDVKVIGKPFTSEEVQQHIEEGKKKAHTVTEITESAKAYMKARIAKTKKQETADKELKKISDQMELVTEPINNFPIGTRVRMIGSNGVFPGFVVNYVHDEGKKGSNPVSPSSWKIVVDVADAKRRIAIPLSKLTIGDGSIDGDRMLINYPFDGISDAEFMKRYDKAQSDSREQRAIVTGNIPAAFGQLKGTGEIITFDMHDGSRIMGIMLPKGFDAQKTMEDMPVKFNTADQIISFIGSIRKDGVINSTDGVISISVEKTSYGSVYYNMSVPASKADGGKWFLDEELINRGGSEFMKRGKFMRMEIDSDNDALSNVLTYLTSKGVQFQTTSDKHIALSIMGIPEERGSLASLGGEGKGISIKSVRDAIRGADKTAKTKTTVVKSFDDLPNDVCDKFSGNAKSLEGVNVGGTVYLVSDNIASPERAVQVWMHEHVGHDGFEALMSDKEKRQLTNRLFALLGGVNSKSEAMRTIKRLAIKYSQNLNTPEGRDYVMREYLARLAEKESLTEQEQTVWRRLWNHIASTLRKAWHKLTGNNVALAEDTIRDLLKAMKHQIPLSQRFEPNVDDIRYSIADNDELLNLADAVESAEEKARTEYRGSFWNNPKEAYKAWKETRSARLRTSGKGDTEDVGYIAFMRSAFWLGKKVPHIEQMRQIELDREEFRSKMTQDFTADFVETYRSLSEQGIEYLRNITVQLDRATMTDPVTGKKGKIPIKMQSEKFLEDFLLDEKGNIVIEDGAPIMIPNEINEEYYRELFTRLENQADYDLIDDRKAFREAIGAYVAQRLAYDKMELEFIKHLSSMKAPTNLIDSIRREISDRPFYYPHMRFGNWFVAAKIKETETDDKGNTKDVWKTVERIHYDAITSIGADLQASTYIKALKALYPGCKIEHGKIDRVPEEAFESATASDVTQVLSAAAERMKKNGGKVPQDVLDQLAEATAHIFMERGIGQRQMHRGSNFVAGFQTENLMKTMMMYASGLSGALTKYEAARRFNETMADFLKRHPEHTAANNRTYDWMRNYSIDLLRNSDIIDRNVARVKSALYLKYLGGNIKSGIVNLTQNPTIGLPMLASDIGTKEATRQYFTGARKAILAMLGGIGKGEYVDKLTDEENDFLDKFWKSAAMRDTYNREVRGLIKGRTNQFLEKVLAIVGAPMEYTERFNRLSFGLAVYRAARDGKIRNKQTCKQFGFNPDSEWTEEAALNLAKMRTREVHGGYGIGERPQLYRHGSVGRVLNAGFTFKTIQLNNLELWRAMLTSMGKEGRKAFALSMASLWAFGGVASIPFLGSFGTVTASMLSSLFGGDDDPDRFLKKHLGKSTGSVAYDWIMYGTPAIAGVTIKGSLSTDLPFTDMNTKYGWTGGIGLEVLKTMFGAGYSTVEQGERAVKAIARGKYRQGVEYILPSAVANLSKAERLYSDGNYSVKGRPIPNTPGEKTAGKLSGGEAVGQAIGFSPVSRIKAWDMKNLREDLQKDKSSMTDDLVTRFIDAEDNKDISAKNKIVQEWRDWNKSHRNDEKMQIRPLPSLAKARRKPIN